MLVLASSSKYRRELLGRLRLEYVAETPDVDETAQRGETPAATALRLAEAKARAVATRYAAALVIGCDQVLEVDGRHIGKPLTRANAIAQLQSMVGQVVLYHSAICLLNPASDQLQRDDVVTRVRFRQLTTAQIERYVDVDDALEVAGGVKAESLGIALMESVESEDPTAIIGLPLIALARMLLAVGVEVF
jgi:septum formation protein